MRGGRFAAAWAHGSRIRPLLERQPQNRAPVGGAVELDEGGIRRYERTHAVTAGIDCMINLVALPSMPHSVQDPLTNHLLNVVSALSVVSAARFAGTQRVVMASFSLACGCAQKIPERERLLPQLILPSGCGDRAVGRREPARSLHDLPRVTLGRKAESR